MRHRMTDKAPTTEPRTLLDAWIVEGIWPPPSMAPAGGWTPPRLVAAIRAEAAAWSDAPLDALPVSPKEPEPGLREAAQAFAAHVAALGCDHDRSGAGTHTGCPERLALDAALRAVGPAR